MNTKDVALSIRLAQVLCQLRGQKPHDAASHKGCKSTNLIVAEHDVKLVLSAIEIDRERRGL